jgi:hypothetical protein
MRSPPIRALLCPLTLLALLCLALPLTASAHLVRAAHNACGGLWSQGSTWDTGKVPESHDFVQIDQGCVVVYDLASSPPLAEINIDGSLVFALDKSTELTVSLLLIEPSGKLEIGTAAMPLPPEHTATIRLVDLSEQRHTHMHGQPQMAPALHTHGGTLTLAGAAKTSWALLTADAPAGATTLSLAEAPQGWRVGDTLVVSGTNRMYPKGYTARDWERSVPKIGDCTRLTRDMACIDPHQWQTEEGTLAAIEGSTVTLAAPLKYGHLGTAPRQAAVGNLTRNIVITSADPAGRRGHVMVAHGFVVKDDEALPPLTSLVTAHLSHVEFAHLGRPEPGLYPVHFHRLGNEGRNRVLVGASIHHSQNLCVRVHTTNFLTVADTVCYDALGHGFATEDGTEMFNTFHHNLAVRTRHAAVKTNPNDPTDVNEGSGFWLNNPHNTLTANYAADNEGWGYQVDPRTTGGVSPRGVAMPLVDATGAPRPPTDVTTVPLLSFVGNAAAGGYLGGIELVNLTRPTTLQDFQSIDSRIGSVYEFTSQLTIETLRADIGPISYAIGAFAGITLPMGRTVRLVTPQITGAWPLSYQSQAPALIEGGTVQELVHTNVVSQNLLVVLAQGAQVAQFTLDAQNHPPETTSQLEVYLFDFDGPGQHRKLMQAGTRAADALAYGPSTAFPQAAPTCATLTPELPRRGCWQEARFTGPTNHGTPLRLPVFITVGNDPWNQHGQLLGRDVIDPHGRRWMADHLYTNLPADTGYHLPRYGRSGGSLVRSDVTSLYGTTLVRTTSAPMWYRIDVPNGSYHVDLHFIERWQGLATYISGRGKGSRVFDIRAQGHPLVTGLDVFVEAGGLENPLVKSFDGILVTQGHLLLEWPTRNGMLSALAVCRPDQVVQGQCGVTP